jgi:hypothetical protein
VNPRVSLDNLKKWRIYIVVPRIEPQFLGNPVPRLVTIPALKYIRVIATMAMKVSG